jgi:hypothetical protein
VYRPQSFVWGLRIGIGAALLILLAGGFAPARRRFHRLTARAPADP